MKYVILLFSLYQTMALFGSDQNIYALKNPKLTKIKETLELKINFFVKNVKNNNKKPTPSPLKHVTTAAMLTEIRQRKEKKKNEMPLFFIGSPSSGSDFSFHSDSDLSSENENLPIGTVKRQKYHRKNKSKNENISTCKKTINSSLPTTPLQQHQEKYTELKNEKTENIDSLLEKISTGKRGLLSFQKKETAFPISSSQPSLSSFSNLLPLMDCIEEEE